MTAQLFNKTTLTVGRREHWFISVGLSMQIGKLNSLDLKSSIATGWGMPFNKNSLVSRLYSRGRITFSNGIHYYRNEKEHLLSYTDRNKWYKNTKDSLPYRVSYRCYIFWLPILFALAANMKKCEEKMMVRGDICRKSNFELFIILRSPI